MSKQQQKSTHKHRVLESSGPHPFTTRALLSRPHQTHNETLNETIVLWLSRAHRKRLVSKHETIDGLKLLRTLWMPGELNWWIGVIFAMGASLFTFGCLLFLLPTLQSWFQLTDIEVNGVFFAGSIPFTTAAYLQLFQAANAPFTSSHEMKKPDRRYYFGWRPRDIGWLSCSLQFVGTVFFNFNTFDAMLPGLSWWQQELQIWLPNILGSILFLTSGYLAFVETCHKHLAWKPGDISWWVTLINFLGCIGFIIAAVFAFVLPGQPNEIWITFSLLFTLQGAICFFTGSLLMLPEMVVAPK